MKEDAVVCLAQLQYRIHKTTTPGSIMTKSKAARMGAFMAAAQRSSFTNFKLVTDLWVRLALLLTSFNFRLYGLSMLRQLVKYLVRFLLFRLILVRIICQFRKISIYPKQMVLRIIFMDPKVYLTRLFWVIFLILFPLVRFLGPTLQYSL